MSCFWRASSPADWETCSWGCTVWPWASGSRPSGCNPRIGLPVIFTKAVSGCSSRGGRSPLRCWSSSSYWWGQPSRALTLPWRRGIPVPAWHCPMRSIGEVPARPLPWMRGSSLMQRLPAPGFLHSSIPGAKGCSPGSRSVSALVPVGALSWTLRMTTADGRWQIPSTLSEYLQKQKLG